MSHENHEKNKTNPDSTTLMLISSPKVRAAAAEDDLVGFKLNVINADHNVTQLSLLQDLAEDRITDAAHCPNVTREV